MTYFNNNICLYNLTIGYIVQTVTKHKIAFICGFTVFQYFHTGWLRQVNEVGCANNYNGWLPKRIIFIIFNISKKRNFFTPVVINHKINNFLT